MLSKKDVILCLGNGAKVVVEVIDVVTLDIQGIKVIFNNCLYELSLTKNIISICFGQ